MRIKVTVQHISDFGHVSETLFPLPPSFRHAIKMSLDPESIVNNRMHRLTASSVD